MIRKYWLLFTLCLVSNLPLHAQMYDSFVHDGEFGASLGLGHYFGDLNPTGKLNKPKFSGGLFYRKNQQLRRNSFIGQLFVFGLFR